MRLTFTFPRDRHSLACKSLHGMTLARYNHCPAKLFATRAHTPPHPLACKTGLNKSLGQTMRNLRSRGDQPPPRRKHHHRPNPVAPTSPHLKQLPTAHCCSPPPFSLTQAGSHAHRDCAHAWTIILSYAAVLPFLGPRGASAVGKLKRLMCK